MSGIPDDVSSGSEYPQLPPGVYIPPGERLATFFLVLEEQIHWLPGFPLQRLRPIDPLLYRYLDIVHDEADEGGRHDAGERRVMEFSSVMESSLLLHQADTDADVVSGLDVVMQIVSRVRGNEEVLASENASRPQAQRTVAEVVVPLGTLARVQSCDTGQAVDSWESADEELLLSDAYDLALEHLREVQKAYSRAMREPTTLATRQLQPMLSPYVVREGHVLPGAADADWGFFMPHDNFSWMGLREQLTYDQISLVRDHIGRPHALSAYLELVDQAKVAHASRGNTREAVAMLGAASEALVGTVLKHLMWEEKRSPEEAGRDLARIFGYAGSSNVPRDDLGAVGRRRVVGRLSHWYSSRTALASSSGPRRIPPYGLGVQRSI